MFVKSGSMLLAAVLALALWTHMKSAGPEGLLQAPMNDAAASTLAPSTLNQGKTIVISSQGGTIVGQMAKIPAGNEQITEIKSVSNVDNRAGRELLSIVSKY